MAGLPNPLAVGGPDSQLENGQSFSIQNPMLAKLSQLISMLGVPKQAAGRAISRIPKDAAADVGISPTPMGYLSGPTGKALANPEQLEKLVQEAGFGSWTLPKRLLAGANEYLDHGGFTKQPPLKGGHVLFNQSHEGHDFVADTLGFSGRNVNSTDMAEQNLLKAGGIRMRNNQLTGYGSSGPELQDALLNMLRNDPRAADNGGKMYGQIFLGKGAPYGFYDVGEKELADPSKFMARGAVDHKDKAIRQSIEEYLYNLLSGKSKAAGVGK